MKNLAVITARSGSKGLPHKNIKDINGKPLIAYSILAAKESGLFDEIYVSTDSEEYATIAKQWGASVPFMRSEALASDSSSSWDSVVEAIAKYKKLGKEFDTVTLLQPTSPLRAAKDIQAGYEMLEQKQASAIIGVCEMDHSPLWSNVLPEDKNMGTFIRDEVRGKNRQMLPTYYRINGALYIVTVEKLEDIANLYSESCYAYVMPAERSVDIDTLMDFKIAEVYMKTDN